VLRWLAEADDLLAGRPDSIVQTEALLVRSSLGLFAAQFERAIDLAREALRHIGNLDRPDLRARAFDLIGTCRVSLGDEGGLDDQRQAIEIAREGRVIWELHTAMNNHGVAWVELGFFDVLEQNLEDRRRVSQEIGSTAGTNAWLLDAEAQASYFAGDWDTALQRIGSLLDEFGEGQMHYLEADVRAFRAWIEFARDELGAGLANAVRAAEVSVRSGDPQSIAGSLCARACILFAQGEIAQARAEFDELLALGEGLLPALNTIASMPAFVWLAIDLGRRGDAERVLAAPGARRWAAVAKAILADDAATAAELLAEIGHRPAEAYARLRAGGAHVSAALAFYRSVGAERYVRKAERLLAASA
jgi:tetratricopeptide (TPR) repeat protein